MKVFFSTSVSRERYLLPVTKNIVKNIEEMGHEVVNKELVDPEHTKDPNWDKKKDGKKVYKQSLEKMMDADVLITECTNPSFGAAFFIDEAVDAGKPLLSLHWGEFETNATLMLRGRKKEINLKMYTDENVTGVLKRFFGKVSA